MFLLLSLVTCEEYKWEKPEFLSPDPDTLGLYGRAIAISDPQTRVLAVSASWDGYLDFDETKDDEYKTAHAHGAIYIYEYVPEKLKYVYKDKLVPQNTDTVEICNFGSTVQISKSGTRIVSGAPYSNVKNGEEWVQQVGAVVIFDKKGDKWTQSQVLTIKNPIKNSTEVTEFDEYQGLGRSLSTDDDCQLIAAAYYNKPGFKLLKKFQGKVWTSSEGPDGKFGDLVPITPHDVFPDSTLKGKLFKFGSDIQFTSATTMIIATQLFSDSGKPIESEFGTAYLYQNNGVWQVNHTIPTQQPQEGKQWSMYGQTISMPRNSQRLFATMGLYGKPNGDFYNNGTFFIFSRENDLAEWKVIQEINFEGDATFGTIEFCDDSTFLNQITNYKDTDGVEKPAVLVYRRQDDGTFAISETLTIDPYPDEHNQFASSVSWDYTCNTIFVGSMAKVNAKTQVPFKGSQAIIFSRAATAPHEDDNKGNKNLGLYIGLPIAFIVIVVVIIVVVICIRKNNKMKEKSSGSAQSV